MNNENINIEYSPHDLKLIINKLIVKHPHGELIADCIFEELVNTETGLKNLLLAQQGTVITLKSLGYKLNQKLTVRTLALSTWRMDIHAMQQAQIILNDTIECTLVDYNRSKASPFCVKYKGINDSGTEYMDENWIDSHYIKNEIL